MRPQVLTGTHFMNGDYASAEGAVAAGCTFFAGYPITPATEIAERMSDRLPEVNGIFIQMEDEMASMAAILGASWGGSKAMTATSLSIASISISFFFSRSCCASHAALFLLFAFF